MSIQAAILLFTGTALLLIALPESIRWRRWGYLIGLLAQPFWYCATYRHEQWGMFIVSLLCTFSWMLGVWNYLIRPCWEQRAKGKT